MVYSNRGAKKRTKTPAVATKKTTQDAHTPPKKSQKPLSGHWLFGKHAIAEALKNPKRQHLDLIGTEESIQDIALDSLKCPVRKTTRAELDTFFPDAIHQGLALKTNPLPQPELESFLRKQDEAESVTLCILDQVTDPQNIGAILRSAAAFGIQAIIVQDKNSPPETAAMAKTACGGLEIVPLIRVSNITRALETMKQYGYWTYGLAGEATQSFKDTKITGKSVIILGSEGKGLRRLVREHCDHLVKIPMTTHIESLNVSNAAAIAFYEIGNIDN
jgi:23S rRNA (guanosine2251-2'-O)-methyltransferase